MSELSPLDALRAHAAQYPQSGLMTADANLTYAAVVADADARIEAARRTGRLEGYEQRAKESALVIAKETTYGTAPKQLREWPAPDGERFRWNPEINAVECYAEGTGWYEVHAGIVLDHADALNALRADPYVPAPKELRGIVLDVVDRAYAAGNRGPSYGPWLGITEETDALLALIDRERPALGEVDAEVLVAEMEKRGWKVREVGYSSHGDIYHSTEGEDPRTAYGINRVRRVLIAPERAG